MIVCFNIRSVHDPFMASSGLHTMGQSPKLLLGILHNAFAKSFILKSKTQAVKPIGSSTGQMFGDINRLSYNFAQKWLEVISSGPQIVPGQRARFTTSHVLHQSQPRGIQGHTVSITKST